MVRRGERMKGERDDLKLGLFLSIQRGLASTDAIAIGKIRLIREAMMTEHASISLSCLANKHSHSRHIAFTLYATVHNVRWAILLEFLLENNVVK